MLKITNLIKKYDQFVAVDNLTLHISPGTIYGFLGHNGAGKTTTIKAAIGILPFESGEILVNGNNVKEKPLACKKDIAYIPDNPDLYEYLTGEQYIHFICDVYQIDKQTRQENIRKYSDLLKISEHLAQPIHSYSHGMKQKVAIVAAFVHSPKLIVMDEPFVGLDPITSKNLKTLMREYCDKGNSIFFSTHVLEVAEKLCDHIAIIKKGKLVISGVTSEIIGNESLEDFYIDLLEDHA